MTPQVRDSQSATLETAASRPWPVIPWSQVPLDDPLYPSHDGYPTMGESSQHAFALSYLIDALRDAFRARPDVFVARDMFIYFEEGRPSRKMSPDCMVIFGVDNRPRRSFKVWEEGGALPSAVFEFASKWTCEYDVAAKPNIYQGYAIPEYFIFDPEGGLLDRPFYAYRSETQDHKGGPIQEYVDIPFDVDGGVTSQSLGLRFVPEGHILRALDAATGRKYLSNSEKLDEIERLNAELQRRNGKNGPA